MVSFLFHSKGYAPCVNQKSIIQNHLFLMVLLEKRRDMATSMVIWVDSGRTGWARLQCGLLQPGLRVRQGACDSQVISHPGASHTACPVPHSELPKAERGIPSLFLLPTGQRHYLR